VSRGLHQDLVQLRTIGLNGYMSCQVQRAFFPTGLGMVVMGSTLWNSDLPFDVLAEEYYRDAFGEDGPACRAYLESLSAARAAGMKEEMLARLEAWSRLLWELEPELHHVLDVWMYQDTIQRRLGGRAGSAQGEEA
jgi:hypothetical protein